jgi:hypothetical protein
MTWTTFVIEISGRFAKRAFIQHRLLVNQPIHLRRRTQLADVVGNAIGTRGGLAQDSFLANLVGHGVDDLSNEPEAEQCDLGIEVCRFGLGRVFCGLGTS